MKVTKVIFLFLAFVLPLGIFMFLKLFGRNEFDVEPLFVREAPAVREGCGPGPSLPYFVPDSIRVQYLTAADSLTVIFFGPLSGEELNQLDRIREQTAADPVQVIESGNAVKSVEAFIPGSDTLAGASPESAGSVPATTRVDTETIRRCIFFLDEEMDVVMLDRRGAIRGQYTAGDRDDMDRLLTEITIILKKY